MREREIVQGGMWRNEWAWELADLSIDLDAQLTSKVTTSRPFSSQEGPQIANCSVIDLYYNSDLVSLPVP